MNYDNETKEILIEKAEQLMDLFKHPDVDDIGYIKAQARKIINEMLSVLSVTVVR